MKKIANKKTTSKQSVLQSSLAGSVMGKRSLRSLVKELSAPSLIFIFRN